MSHANPNYSIHLDFEGGDCVASIAELALAERGATPEQALAAVLRAQAASCRALEAAGTPLPPPAGKLDPAPGVTRSARRAGAFLGRVLAGYAAVALVTLLVLAMAAPYVRARVEQYVGGGAAATDVTRLLSRLGVVACAERR